MSSSQLTFIFFRGVAPPTRYRYTINLPRHQPSITSLLRYVGLRFQGITLPSLSAVRDFANLSLVDGLAFFQARPGAAGRGRAGFSGQKDSETMKAMGRLLKSQKGQH